MCETAKDQAHAGRTPLIAGHYITDRKDCRLMTQEVATPVISSVYEVLQNEDRLT